MHSQQPSSPYAPQAGVETHSCSTAQQTTDGSHYYPHGTNEYSANPTAVAPSNAPVSQVGTWFEFSNSGYLKGFLIGAGVTLVLTNPTVQKALVKGTVKVWSTLQGGVEEVKEQFRDVKAEMSEEK